ncbi:MAG TPA: peptide-methionine (S)-S-oxide reductase [Rhodospirillaceae bacterium]|nr:peptide-methionine (S)-S-oxide reductase [Rhodospirillaceae bacterium]
MHVFRLFLLVLLTFMIGLPTYTAAMEKGSDLMDKKPDGYPVATLAGGCFWCLESEYRALNGVLFTRVGYMGGAMDTPSYRDVTTGKTGHAEVIEVTFDPAKMSYEQLIEYFLTKAHDPTTLNRQGVDTGTQYRSAIFYHDEEQKRIAEKAIARVEMNKIYKNPIVTEIVPAGTFWEGEDYHQQYYEKYEAENGQPHIRVLLKHQRKR